MLYYHYIIKLLKAITFIDSPNQRRTKTPQVFNKITRKRLNQLCYFKQKPAGFVSGFKEPNLCFESHESHEFFRMLKSNSFEKFVTFVALLNVLISQNP